MIIVKSSTTAPAEAASAISSSRREAQSFMAASEATQAQKARASAKQEAASSNVEEAERAKPPQAASEAPGLRGPSGEAAAAIEQQERFPAPLKVALSAYMQALPPAITEEIKRLEALTESGKPVGAKPAGSKPADAVAAA